ncbi:hypothetical protein Patl1_29635 [Pistacia atlantica]|uniref:Uncharacterized protein n=1 Tax=Pistacia atlantica TaxID=434234 RepID=A0ACC1AB57_9ROSI|nr:hypothetical protein Patl1_29635 [Pistacia atlantica]
MMGSNEFTGNPLLEPRDDMEFESHEAAYSFYKEYAKAMGFGTAKLSSRRSRASREFIDAKFSCIRFGNKQQSDDAINPRPSPKIGCKARAAACHLKKENEVDTASTYSVKDFEDDQNYMMSGVFNIPSKYILQRWTNAAKSKHAMSERLDEVQSKVRRYNDLCRRAIILGEEGSLSQESYNIALGAIQEALKQCTTLNNFMENNVRPVASDILALCDAEEENQFGNTSKDKVPNPSVTSTNSNPSRTEAGKGKGINANKKGKSTSCMWQITQPGTMNVETQDGCHQMELSDMRPTQLHNFVPTQLQVLPTMFHNVPTTQFHNVTTTNLPDNRLPR